MPRTIKGLFLFVTLAWAVCSLALAQENAYTGTYVADLPSASGCGRRLVLELFTDDSYFFVQRYLCKPWTLAQIETGSWTLDSDHVVLSSAESNTRFSIGAAGLGYIGSRYGQAGLHLLRLK
jgi:hypothetical protein